MLDLSLGTTAGPPSYLKMAMPVDFTVPRVKNMSLPIRDGRYNFYVPSD
jgi:hypothetical protein